MCTVNSGPTTITSLSQKVTMTLYRDGTLLFKDQEFQNIRAALKHRKDLKPGTTGYIKTLSGGILEYLR